MTWPVVAIADVTESSQYGTSAKAGPDGAFPILRMGNITYGGRTDLTDLKYIDLEAQDVERYTVRAGDILFNRTNSPALVGKTAVFQEVEPYAFAGYLVRLRTNSRADPRFVSAYLNSPRGKATLRSMAKSIVGMANINARELGSIHLPLPPLEEQRRIAAILDQADSLRNFRKRALDRLEDLGQSLFHQIIGDPLTNSLGWRDDLLLGEVAELVSGITKGRKLTGAPTRVVPYLAVANVQDRFLRLGGVKEIEATEAEIARYRLRRDDLLLTEGGDPDKLGRGALWKEEIPEAIHQNHVFRVRLTSGEISPTFLNWLVGSLRGKRYFLRSAKQTTGIASINMGQLKRFPLLVPPIGVQQHFATAIAAVENQVALGRRSLEELDALFACLQHRAFRGELARSDVPALEPD